MAGNELGGEAGEVRLRAFVRVAQLAWARLAGVAVTVVMIVQLRGFSFGCKGLPFAAAGIGQPLVGVGLIEACLFDNPLAVTGPRVVLGCGTLVVRCGSTMVMRGVVGRVA